jgi:anti-sigma28 factor (negative regulator of flagellin synthesis)
MGILEIDGKPLPVDQFKGRSSDKCDTREVSQNKVQLSDEARALYEAQAKKIEQIHEEVRNGFNFQQEGTERVVELLLKDLTKL